MPKFKFILFSILIVLLFIALNSNALVYEYEFNGEPAGDVTQFDPYGNSTIVDGYSDIDIKRFETRNGTGDNLTFTMGTKAKSITIASNIKYVFRVFTKSDNRTGYNISFCNGTIELVEIIDGIEQMKEDITGLGGIVKDKNDYVLEIDLSKSRYFPEDELDYFNVDGFSWMEEGNYTYVDYIHSLPGNPGTISQDIIEDETPSGSDSDDKGEGSSILLPVLIIITLIVVIMIAVLISRRKK